jgi:uncharacterized protein (UPF0332 family)
MDPRDFHTQAVNLLRAGQPADCRSAISRAYYAAFHVAATILRSNGFAILENHHAHEQVTRHLLGSGHPAVVAVASQLRELRGMRNKADYRLSLAVVEAVKTAQMSVANAGGHIRTLETSFGGPDRDQIVANIAAWKSKSGS